jgi:hypothetical protein
MNKISPLNVIGNCRLCGAISLYRSFWGFYLAGTVFLMPCTLRRLVDPWTDGMIILKWVLKTYNEKTLTGNFWFRKKQQWNFGFHKIQRVFLIPLPLKRYVSLKKESCFSPSTSVCPNQCHFISVPYPIKNLTQTLNVVSNRQGP